MAPTPAKSPYKDSAFLASEAARTIRIICELEGTKTKLDANNVSATVLIFGSARARSSAQFSEELQRLTDLESSAAPNAEELEKIASSIRVLKTKEVYNYG